MGYVSGAWAIRASKLVPNHSQKLDMFWWVVGFKVLVLRFMFQGTQFLTSRNEHWATTETQYVFMLVFSKAPTACVWKPALGHFEANNTFTIFIEIMLGKIHLVH
jgi:hypothetical protein